MVSWKVGLVTGLVFGIASAAMARDSCSFKGTDFSDGSTTCQSGIQYRCDDGKWKSLAVTCPTGDKVSSNDCTLNGTQYAAGSASCQSGMKYRCSDGKWISLETACVAGDAPRVVPPPAAKTCMLEGSTVANASTVCKSGTMFVCDNGDWRNLGTPCQ